MTIDLDELERDYAHINAPAVLVGKGVLAELIALARKGEFYDEHVLTETANHLAETAKEWKERAEAYRRALQLARHALEKGRDDTRPLAIKVIDKVLEIATAGLTAPSA